MNNKKEKLVIKWPNGLSSVHYEGEDWLTIAYKAGINIPTGCLGGSCGACEIEVNGEVIRACISKVTKSKDKLLEVSLEEDPFW